MSWLKRGIAGLSPPWVFRLRARLAREPYRPPVGKVSFGDLRRLGPLSSDWGFDRGGAIDRYYVEQFLRTNSHHIRGRVLEAGEDLYSSRIGGDAVEQVDVLQFLEPEPTARFVGDLADGTFLPTAAFDCIVLTQTLHFIFDFESALLTLNRIIRPGGVLLLTSPGITNLDPDRWGSSWYYSFSTHALREVVARGFESERVEMSSYGNVLAASAFLYGVGASELTPDELDHHDPSYPVIAAVKAVRS